jgi:Fuc2NAc and GlcNAc transferase
LDDPHNLSPKKRLLIQMLVATTCVSLLGDLSNYHLFSKSTVYLGWVGFGLSALALVWSINLFNFMDGLDGLAAVEALCVLSMGGWLYWYEDHKTFALLIWALGISVAGFLVWNWPKARIFMGDAGSYCLGFLIALFALIGESWYSIPVVYWIILYGVFWFDATITILRRLYRGNNVAYAHREHAYQRLHRAGFSHKQVLSYVLVLNSILASIAVLARFNPDYLGLGLSIAILILIIAYCWVEKIKPMERKIKC